MEEPEIAVVGTKGQFVIPQDLRRRLAITPKTKLAIYRRGDKLVVAKLKAARQPGRSWTSFSPR